MRSKHEYAYPVVKEIAIQRAAVDRDTFNDHAQVNPWVRANLEQYSEETLELIPSPQIDAYVNVVDELVLAGEALQNAQERFRRAQEARAQFFQEFIP